MRSQLTSSVDLAPLLLTIGSGGDHWRTDTHYSHLAGRADLAGDALRTRSAGARFVLHATDETVTEFAVEEYAAGAPLHVVAMRTQEAKYATYSHWPEEGIAPLTEGEESELYDYGTATGRLELHSSAGEHTQLEATMREELHHAFYDEMREPLPNRLEAAHGRGFADYFSTARTAAAKAANRRREHVESSVGDLTLGQGGPPPQERPALSPSGRPKRRARHR